MMFLKKEGDKVSVLEPPNDAIKALETKANEISFNILSESKPQKPRFDEGLNLFKCQDCRKEQSSIMVFTDLKLYHSEQIKNFLTDEKWPTDTMCDCGRWMGPEDLEGWVLNRYVPELDLQLQYRIFPIEGSTKPYHGFYKVDRNGVQPIGHELNHDVMVDVFGKSFNVKESWWSLIGQVLDSKKVGGLIVEEGYNIGLIPPYDTEDEMMKEVHALMDTFPKPERPVLEHLSNLENNNLPFYEETYHEWSDDAERLFADGSFGTVILFDLAKLDKRVQWDLKRRGLEFQQDPEDGLLYRVRKGELSETLDLRDTTLEGIHKALTFYEMATRSIDNLMEYFDDAEKFIENVKKVMTRCTFVIKGHMLLIKDPEGKEQEINILTMPRKVGYEGEGFDNYLNYLSGVFSGRASKMDICECGLPTYVTKIIKPINWPKVDLPPEVEGTEKDPRVGMLAHDAETYKVVYSLDCKHHSKFLNRTDLKKWKLTPEQLEERWEKDLDLNFYGLDVYFMRTSNDRVVAFIGHGVASLALSPSLVLGALQKAGITLAEDEVIATSNHTDILIITPVDTPETYTRHLEQRAAEIHVQNMGERGSPLELKVEMVLKDDPRGNFELEETKEI